MTVPTGDVLAVVLESEMATITSATLAACGEEKPIELYVR